MTINMNAAFAHAAPLSREAVIDKYLVLDAAGLQNYHAAVRLRRELDAQSPHCLSLSSVTLPSHWISS